MRPPSPFRVVFGLAILAVQSVSAAPAAPAVSIEADLLQLGADLQRAKASGDARLAYDDLQLAADRIVADHSTGRVEASGDLSLAQGQRRLKGDRLEFEFATNEGVISEACVAEQGVIIRGEKIEFSPQRLVAHSASFTTCDLAHPHYSLGANRISLTAEETLPDGRPRSGRLTFDRVRIMYHGRSLFTLPRYSVMVGDLGEPGKTPLPLSGFNRDDGPYAAISYALGGPDDLTLAELSYRYTSFRGSRGHLRLERTLGAAALVASYVRREDAADRELPHDEIAATLAKVLVDRAPEYGVRLPEFRLGSSVRLRAEWLQGSYFERDPYHDYALAQADRTSTSLVLTTAPYDISRGITAAHALGWHRSTYSPGDHFFIRYHRHTVDFDRSPATRLSLSYIARDGSGATPFLFDQPDIGRELLAQAEWRISSRWRLSLADSYDLDERYTRDITLSVTRTVHCLDYTVGWRKARGTFFIGVGLATLPSQEPVP
jgi:lipopolysaccharide export system protein LptA